MFLMHILIFFLVLNRVESASFVT